MLLSLDSKHVRQPERAWVQLPSPAPTKEGSLEEEEAFLVRMLAGSCRAAELGD